MLRSAVPLLFILCVSAATADVLCAPVGTPPDHINPDLPAKILKWTEAIENNMKISVPLTANRAMVLQAAISNWQNEVAPNTSEYFYRQAVAHGVNVQYETLMVSEDPSHAETHRHWIDVESARAEACLELISPAQ